MRSRRHRRRLRRRLASGPCCAFCWSSLIYRVWRWRDLWPIFRDTVRESVMILMIIGTSILFGYMLT